MPVPNDGAGSAWDKDPRQNDSKGGADTRVPEPGPDQTEICYPAFDSRSCAPTSAFMVAILDLAAEITLACQEGVGESL